MSGCPRSSGRPGPRDPRPGLCWSELVFTELSDREVVPTAGKAAAVLPLTDSGVIRAAGDEARARKSCAPHLGGGFGADEDARPLTWTACSSRLPVRCSSSRDPGVWVQDQAAAAAQRQPQKSRQERREAARVRLSAQNLRGIKTFKQSDGLGTLEDLSLVVSPGG